jgi:hypothetical protein
MKTVKTYRKYTATEIVAAAAANPQMTNGGDFIARMSDGDICFGLVHPAEHNGYEQKIVLFNCMSIHTPANFGAPVVALGIEDEELAALEAIESELL